jgi:leader peptidase (prepilin peptidase)/N-methyltransferase
MILLYAGVGLLVGGALNVLADTLPGRTRLRMSYCAHCDGQRQPVVWLATTGYLLMQGRCPNCGAPVPLRNVLVELTTAVAFALLYNRYGLTGHLLLVSAYTAILILVTVTDLEHRLILNQVIGPAILLALIAGWFTPGLSWRQALVGGLVGFGFFYVAALLYPGGMGAGDVKLAAFIGLITGFPVVILALLVTIMAGGLISLVLVVTRIRSLRDAIPYGPFLVIGGAFALFWGQPIVDSYLEQARRDGAIEQWCPYPVCDVVTGWTQVWGMDGRQSTRSSASQSSSRSSWSHSPAWRSNSSIKSHSSRASSATWAISWSGSPVSSSNRIKAPSQPV